METQYSTDLCKLKTMLKNQEMQKDLIRKDIRTLSHKSRNLAPIEVKLKTDKEKRRPKLTFDGSEHDMDYQRTCLMDNLGFTAIDDSEYYKKIIAVCIKLKIKISTNFKINTIFLTEIYRLFRYDIYYHSLAQQKKQTLRRL